MHRQYIKAEPNDYIDLVLARVACKLQSADVTIISLRIGIST
jgi:hypothetical protein